MKKKEVYLLKLTWIDVEGYNHTADWGVYDSRETAENFIKYMQNKFYTKIKEGLWVSNINKYDRVDLDNYKLTEIEMYYQV